MIHLKRVKHFFAAYFHQDWMHEYDTMDEAIDEFAESGSLSERTLFIKEMEELTTMAVSGEFQDSDLRPIFGCYYNPKRRDQDLVWWLEYVTERVAKVISVREKSNNKLD